MTFYLKWWFSAGVGPIITMALTLIVSVQLLDHFIFQTFNITNIIIQGLIGIIIAPVGMIVGLSTFMNLIQFCKPANY